MKVFIGWAGEPSREVARCLSGWLPRVLQAVEPWFSDEAITPGSPWLTDLLNSLESQDFFVACVTPASLASGWFNFEIGVAAGALFAQPDLQKRVCPLLYDIDPADVEQPVAMFQGVRADEGGLRKLVKVLNARLDRALKEIELDAAFDKWWPDLRICLGAIEPSSLAPPVRDAKDILVEVLALVRQQTANSYDALTAILRIADAQDEIRRLLSSRSSASTAGGSAGLLQGLIGGVPPVRGAPLPTTSRAYESALKRAFEAYEPPEAPGETRQAE